MDPFTKASYHYQRAQRTNQGSGQAWSGYTPSGWEPCLRLFGLLSLGGVLVAALVGLVAAVALGVL